MNEYIGALILLLIFGFLLHQLRRKDKQLLEKNSKISLLEHKNKDILKQYSGEVQQLKLQNEQAFIRIREDAAINAQKNTDLQILKEKVNGLAEIQLLNEKNLSLISQYKAEIQSLKTDLEKEKAYIQDRQSSLERLLSGNLSAFPYLSGMIADYLLLEEYQNNEYHGKSKRLLERKLRIDTLLREKKELIQRAKEAQYQLDFLLTAFPALSDFLSTDYQEISYEFDYKDYDTVRDYLSTEEYAQLSESERNQLALDRYVESHGKSKWQIGRDYELSVGYQYEKKGYQVQYTGSTEGLADLGRDLIAKKGRRVLIIQCKYWSTEKVIREKHIAQLFGTALCYRVDHPEEEVIPLFVTCTKLSDEAKEFARKLPVSYVEDFSFKEFPRIKCNIGRDEFGPTKIYHLPMDQQYDSVIIDKPGEFMAFTVKEAEEKGFRRAWRWHQS